MTAPSIMALGDSLTAPYVPMLAKLLTEAKVPFRLVGTQGSGALRHEGHGGYTVKRVADGIDGWVSSIGGTPDYVAICLGTNDVVGMPFPDVAKSLESLKNLVAYFRARGSRVLLCTIPPTTAPNSPGALPFNEGVRAYQRSNAARVHLVDLGKLVPASELSSDGVHLSLAGAQRMGRLIARGFSSKVPATPGGPIDKAIGQLKSRRISGLGGVVVAGVALYFLAR